jgi:hypothetical protein
MVSRIASTAVRTSASICSRRGARSREEIAADRDRADERAAVVENGYADRAHPLDDQRVVEGVAAAPRGRGGLRDLGGVEKAVALVVVSEGGNDAVCLIWVRGGEQGEAARPHPERPTGAHVERVGDDCERALHLVDADGAEPASDEEIGRIAGRVRDAGSVGCSAGRGGVGAEMVALGVGIEAEEALGHQRVEQAAR